MIAAVVLSRMPFNPKFAQWLTSLPAFTLALLPTAVTFGMLGATLVTLRKRRARGIGPSHRVRRLFLRVLCPILAGYAASAVFLLGARQASPPDFPSRVWIAIGIIATASIVAGLNYSLARPGEKPGGPRTHSTFADEPIHDRDEDMLRREEFVELVREEIAGVPLGDSHSIGIDGRWGEGKTSVLNLLAARLREDGIKPIEYNPWYYESEAALVLGFYETLADEIDDGTVGASLRQLIRRYRHALSVGAGTIGLGASFGGFADPAQLKREIESALATSQRRHVVLVDDLDRVQPGEIRAVLRLIGLTARLPNVVFVVSMDRAIVTRAVAEDLEVTDEYLEKIFRVSLALPVTPRKTLDRFFLYSDGAGVDDRRSQLDVILDQVGFKGKERDEFDRRFVTAYRFHLHKLLPTLRRMKRVLRDVQLHLPSRIRDVDPFDFLCLSILKCAVPAVYQDIRRHVHVYLPDGGLEWSLGGPFPFGMDAAKRAELRRRHVIELLKEVHHSGAVEGILRELFPVIDAALTGPSSGNIEHQMQGLRERRAISHPDCVDQYFLIARLEDELSDSEALALLQPALEHPSGPEAGLGAALSELRKKGVVGPFLKRLPLYAGEYSNDQRAAVVRQLVREIATLSDEGDLLEWSEQVLAMRAIAAFANAMTEPDAVTALFEELATLAPDRLSLSTLTLRMVRARDFAMLTRTRAGDVLARAADARLTRELIVAGVDLFESEAPRSAVAVLYQWAVGWEAKSVDVGAKVRSYVRELLARRPDRLPRILASFVRVWEQSQEVDFDLEALQKLLSLDEAASILDSLPEETAEASEHREAIRSFRAAVGQRRADPTDPAA